MSGNYYIGLMSGTSADAIDAVIVEISASIKLIGHHSQTLPPHLRKAIHQLTAAGANEIEQASRLDQQLGDLFAQSVTALLDLVGISPHEVKAIGSHGQTIRHCPTTTHQRGFSLQIGDPNIIAHHTGITTVADFRRRDIAAGGQGAPLVPAFHRAVFYSEQNNRAIINIGGIANITWLPREGSTLGFDTGPGNTLMDAWIGKHLGQSYDRDGAWAASGKVHSDLLTTLLGDSFFRQNHPKSTGREAFNLLWLEQALLQQQGSITPADVQATLLALTAKTLADSIVRLTKEENADVFICGGGAYNTHLMATLAHQLPHCRTTTTQELGVAPEHVEAMAFAWLAQQTLKRANGNLCTVTGANKEVILGGVYFA